jgi:hypothetical protein
VPAATRLDTPGALLTRTHLRELGLERRAVDAVFRAWPNVILPGYSRPLIRAADYITLLEEHTYRDDRVHPSSVRRVTHALRSTAHHEAGHAVVA